MAILQVESTVKLIEESRAEIFAMLDARSSSGLVWKTMDEADRRIFCFAAGLKNSDVKKELSQFDDLDRLKLFRAIKSIEQKSKKFSSVSLQEFK